MTVAVALDQPLDESFGRGGEPRVLTITLLTGVISTPPWPALGGVAVKWSPAASLAPCRSF
ncbi:hypothetical protein, partial [Actinacidiphila soli]|uniref:hypothetical protein n=1 Tax=Actinacidiphila soli TaxID=2487275 RepID=UPI0019D0008A